MMTWIVFIRPVFPFLSRIVSSPFFTKRKGYIEKKEKGIIIFRCSKIRECRHTRVFNPSGDEETGGVCSVVMLDDANVC
jgi:hypothetical protein